MSTPPASVTVHLEPLEAISPLIYGQFIEFLSDCIQGGVFEPGSALADADGVRLDVLEKARRLRPPLLRFPGGTAAKIYHWMDGVGPRERRPRKNNVIWGGVIDHAFGTDEYMRYCRSLDAEPFLVVNMSTGTPEEAANWVEYCNGKGGTYYADLRRSHGHEQPFRVTYWGLGNEEAGEPDIGALHDPKRYARTAWEFAKLMKLQDRSIRFVIPGESAAWNKAVLDELHPVCDYLSLHHYARAEGSAYGHLFAQAAKLEETIRATRALLDTYPEQVTDFNYWYRFPPRSGRIRIAVDEWGIWQHSGCADFVSDFAVRFNWKEALYFAGALHVFQRCCDSVGLATVAQMVNVLAPIAAGPGGSICQTIFYPLEMYAKYCGNRRLACEAASEPLDARPGAARVSSLDAAATYRDGSGEVVLTVVNRHPERDIRAVVRFADTPGGGAGPMLAESIVLNCAAWDTVNDFDRPDGVRTTVRVEPGYEAGGARLFPAHSITILRHRPDADGTGVVGGGP